MRVNDMRDALKHKYGNTIRNRHIDYMPDSQVIAIYHSVIERKVSPERKIPKTKRLHEPMRYEQMRMEI